MSERFPEIPNFADLPVGDTHLAEKTLTSKQVYEGYFLKLIQDQVQLPNGNAAGREYLIHPGAVAIVPVLPDGRILLERQYRYPLHQAFIEIPAGKLDFGHAIVAYKYKNKIFYFDPQKKGIKNDKQILSKTLSHMLKYNGHVYISSYAYFMIDELPKPKMAKRLTCPISYVG